MHYTVGVITKEEYDESCFDDILEPFYEGKEVEPYIYRTKQEIIEGVRESIKEVKEDMKSFENGEFDKERKPYWFENCDSEKPIKDYYCQLLQLEDKTDEEIYQYYREGEDEDLYDEDGNELSTYNPDSKWDWFSIGGRWDGYFKLKDAAETNGNSAKISDIIWEGTEEEKKAAARFWEVVVEGAEKTKEEEEDHFRFFSIYNKEYYKKRFSSKEEYVERATFSCPYAIVTPEGEWVAPGEMHWFSSSETDEQQAEYEKWFKKFIDEHQDYYITLVDCHI